MFCIESQAVGSPNKNQETLLVNQAQRYGKLQEVLNILQSPPSTGDDQTSPPVEWNEQVRTALEEAVRLRAEAEKLHNCVGGATSVDPTHNSSNHSKWFIAFLLCTKSIVTPFCYIRLSDCVRFFLLSEMITTLKSGSFTMKSLTFRIIIFMNYMWCVQLCKRDWLCSLDLRNGSN